MIDFTDNVERSVDFLSDPDGVYDNNLQLHEMRFDDSCSEVNIDKSTHESEIRSSLQVGESYANEFDAFTSVSSC